MCSRKPDKQSYLVFRADASALIGAGHLMRCLALGQAWRDSGGEVIFITSCGSDASRQRLADEGFQVVELQPGHPEPDDLKTTLQVLESCPGAWLVLDGYHFDTEYHRAVKRSGHKLLVIDDTAHLRHYCADIVLNQNLHASNLNYSCEPYTKLLLGPKYVLLRKEFMRWVDWNREIPPTAGRILVTMGGSDPDNCTSEAVKALQMVKADGLETEVVIGGSNPHYNELKAQALYSGLNINLQKNAENMPELMARADIAVSAGGSTSWELAYMGLPSILLVLAENQRPVAKHLSKLGAALDLGWYEETAPDRIADAVSRLLNAGEEREKMSRRGREIVDGEGASRAVMRIRGEGLRLRKARLEDRDLLWRWANDWETRASAFSSGFISWEDHVRWFNSKLQNTKSFLWIALDDKEIPVGQVRFDQVSNAEAEIDVSIDRNKRGVGYGREIISRGVDKIFNNTQIKLVHSYVKVDNKASQRAFKEAGFIEKGVENISGCEAVHYERESPKK